MGGEVRLVEQVVVVGRRQRLGRDRLIIGVSPDKVRLPGERKMADRRDLTRREVMAFAGSAAMAGVAIPFVASAAPANPPVARLETKLFNFKDDISPEQAADLVAGFKISAKAAGIDAFLVGRNLNSIQFPTRFEWIYMLQIDDFAKYPQGAAYERFERAREDLASHCRAEAVCDLDRPLPARFAMAPGVKVRHVVMFNFKPEASSEARDRNVSAIVAMGKLPMVQNYIVARNAPSATGPNQMEWQVIGDYASLADFQAYVDAPVHLAIKEDFTANTSRVAFLDVEV